MQHEIISISLLDGHKRNYRAHPEGQLKKLTASLERFQQVRSIVVAPSINGRYTILAGHGVVEAAKLCGISDIKCDIVPKEWDQATRDAYLVADNMHSQDAEDDQEALAQLLQEQQDAGFDLASLGTDDEALRQLLEGLGDEYLGNEGEDEEDDFEAEPDEEQTRVKLGDVWQLGKHRIGCLDALDPASYEKLLQSTRPYAIITDPPYGMGLDVKSSDLGRGDHNRVSQHPRRYVSVIGDDEDFNPEFIFSLFDDVSEVFLWGADYYAERIPCKNDGSWLVWDKRDGVEDMEFSSSSFELCWSKQKHRRDIIRVRWAGVLGMESQDTKSRVHPTQKPIQLIEDIINRYTSEGQIILDPFLGSGTTVISAERTGRIAYGCELSPAYIDVCITRWEQLTGQQATLLDRLEEATHA